MIQTTYNTYFYFIENKPSNPVKYKLAVTKWNVEL